MAPSGGACTRPQQGLEGSLRALGHGRGCRGSDGRCIHIARTGAVRADELHGAVRVFAYIQLRVITCFGIAENFPAGKIKG